MLFLHNASVSLLRHINPALENTRLSRSTGVNDAGMQSRFMA